MKKIIILLSSLVLAITISACENLQSPPDTPEVDITDEFTDKIVYSANNEETAMIADCDARNGEFNNCGSSCPSDAEVCIEVCVPVCMLSSSQNSGIDETGLNLNVPSGFKISEFATDLSGARDLVGPDELGNFWLSRTEEGIVSLIGLDEEGNFSSVSDIFTGLNNPHGLALDPADNLTLYIAEEDKISSVELYTEAPLQELATLPEGGRHYTRSLLFGPDERLYVSIGSSCDTCIEGDAMRAAIYVMDKDGKNFESYSTGLRNAVFMTLHPETEEIWATEMGRDFLGDDLPPDEINIVEDGNDYGWPYCYGNQVRDNQFRNWEMPEYCENTTAAKIELQAHSAPLGLDFVPENNWPDEMHNDLIVAYHGSWNRSIPTGYKLTHIQLDENQNITGRKDFINGWLTETNETLGRPVAVLFHDNNLYVTDDKRGVIYKIEVQEN